MAIETTSQSLAGAHPEETAASKENQPATVSRFLPAARSGWQSRSTARWTRRNFSSRARELSGGDAIVPFQIAVAPGCEHFSVPIFALAMNTRFLFIPKRTMTLAYLGLSIRMTCMSTIQRPVGGGGCEANFWSRLVKSSEPASFCSRAIPETHSFRTTSK